MERRRLARSEKQLLLLGGGVPLLFLGLGWLYEWNNRVSALDIPQAAPPRPNAFDVFQQAAHAYVPPGIGTAVDWHIDTSPNSPRQCPPLFSPAYNRRYPLAPKLALLSRNAQSLRRLRQGLALDYLQPPERDAKDVVNSGIYRDLARLLIVEAHARAQQGDWDGAADSLLDVARMGYQTPRGGALRAALGGLALRGMAHQGFRAIVPHVSAAKVRTAAHRLKAWEQSRWSAAQALEEEKRSTQGAILGLIRARDFRPLYQNDLNELPPLLQMRLAWMNKPRLLGEYTRCMDWQIDQARKPYPLRAQSWPFPESHDGVEQMIYPPFRLAPTSFLLRDAKDALLITMLALHAYRLENGRYPPALASLVPRHLSQVPLDPFSNRQPLCYRLAPVRYVAHSWQEPVSRTEPGSPPETRLRQRTEQLLFTLYSRGLNARDDGGRPYEKANYGYDDRKRYLVDLGASVTEKADIVGGINH